MSTPFTKNQIEDAIYSALREVWPGVTDEIDIYPDTAGSGRKKEPYARVSASRGQRRTVGAMDTTYTVKSQTEHKATEIDIRDRVVPCSIDIWGLDSYDTAQRIADELHSTAGRRALSLRGLGLQEIDAPISLPYTEAKEQKTRYRIEFDVTARQRIERELDVIETIRISSPQLGIAEKTIDLTGGA